MNDGDGQALFQATSVAIIGASAKTPWASSVLQTLGAIGFEGRIHLVNRRGGELLGRVAATSIAAIGDQVDNAFVMAPAAALPETFEEMAAAGIRRGVVVTSGFAELGSTGAAAQKQVFDRAHDLGLKLMGPNSMGFVNFTDRMALAAIPIPLPLLPDPRVAVISQSGATSALIARTAHSTNVALTHIFAMGNEATVDMADVIDYLVAREEVRSIAIFAESVRRPQVFLAAARRALAAQKPIVMLKVGVGALAAQVAQAHTGALVGDNKVFDAVCREVGIIRVNTVEQLLQTADMLAYTGVVGPGGFAVSSLSGGTCEMIADLGEAAGVPFASLSPQVTDRLQGVLPDFATVQNPLDVTGGVLSNLSAFGDATAILGGDEQVALVAACFDVPQAADRDTPNLSRPVLRHLASGIERSGRPGFLLLQAHLGISDYARDVIRDEKLPHLALGLETAMNAVGAVFRWSARVRESREEVPAAPVAAVGVRPSGEREMLDYLAGRGIPTIPASIVGSADQAAAAAAAIGQPLAMKILSRDIQHKTEVGGVMLNIAGPAGAAAAYDAMLDRVRAAAPDARIEGVIVSPMRTDGIELIVGVARDPTWGLVLAVGLGGIWVELIADAALHLLPVTPAQVAKMLGRLQAGKLLDGYRGQPKADRARIAQVIADIGNAAIALGPNLVFPRD